MRVCVCVCRCVCRCVCTCTHGDSRTDCRRLCRALSFEEAIHDTPRGRSQTPVAAWSLLLSVEVRLSLALVRGDRRSRCFRRDLRQRTDDCVPSNVPCKNGRVLERVPFREARLDCSLRAATEKLSPALGTPAVPVAPGHAVLPPACRLPGCVAVKIHALLHPGDSDVKTHK